MLLALSFTLSPITQISLSSSLTVMSTLNQIQVRDPRNLTVVGDTLYLRGYKQQSYPAPLLELWKSDGTTTGTVSVGIEVESGTGGFIYPLKTANAERIAFNRDTNNTGLELWISDGTAAGTLLVKDINLASLIQSLELC